RWQVVLPVEQTQFTEQVSTTIPSHPTIRQPFKPRGDPGWRRVAGFRLRQRSTSRYCPVSRPTPVPQLGSAPDSSPSRRSRGALLRLFECVPDMSPAMRSPGARAAPLWPG
ncbi:Nonribosomal peptide synthetase fmqA, partial [Dissostichus eleginoides]